MYHTNDFLYPFTSYIVVWCYQRPSRTPDIKGQWGWPTQSRSWKHGSKLILTKGLTMTRPSSTHGLEKCNTIVNTIQYKTFYQWELLDFLALNVHSSTILAICRCFWNWIITTYMYIYMPNMVAMEVMKDCHWAIFWVTCYLDLKLHRAKKNPWIPACPWDK